MTGIHVGWWAGAALAGLVVWGLAIYGAVQLFADGCQ